MWIATGRDKLSGLLEEDWWPFILADKLFSVSPHWLQVMAGEARVVDLFTVGEVSYMDSEGQGIWNSF